MPPRLPDIPIPPRRPLRSLAVRTIEALPDTLAISILAMQRYRHRFGRYPNILRPRTFNEKIQVRKLFDRRQQLCLWADKFGVRDYVAAKVGPAVLAELYHVTTDPCDIPFDKLPRKYVVKPSHGSGWIQIVNDGKTVNKQELIERCKRWLTLNYFDVTGEWVYKNIKPRILIEEFLDSGDGNPPNDFKCFVFGGKVQAIQVDVDRHTKHKRNLYDTKWDRIPCRFVYDNCEDVIPRPASLETMIRYAEILSDKVDFVRVDLYEVHGRVYFGELTNTPENGFGKFEPSSWDATLGKFWRTGMRRTT